MCYKCGHFYTDTMYTLHKRCECLIDDGYVVVCLSCYMKNGNGDFINGYECVECVRDRKIKELLCPNV